MVAVNVILLVTIFLTPVPIPSLAFADLANLNGSKEPTARAPWNATYTDSLKRSLLVGYDKFARPSHHNLATNVSMGISIYHVELDDLSGVMTVHGWIKLAWNDDKLKWNSSDYGNLDSLHVADHEIWQPDIVQYNSASGNTVDQFGNTHCIVFENGTVLWVPPAKLTSFCTMALKHWPQDEQTCIFTFGSWTYNTLQIYINKGDLFEMEINNDFYVNGGEWELADVSQKRYEKFYDCCPEAPYVSIEYRVHVKRLGGGSIRATLLRTPAVVSVVLSLLSHCLPPTSPRLPLAAVSPTLLSIGLLYFAHRLPPSKLTPNIVMYYCISLYMACLSGVITVIVINMSLSRRALPWMLKRALCSRAAKCLRLPQLVEHSTSEELQNTIGGGSGSVNTEEGARILSGSPSPAKDWLALAMAIDRISFIILLVIFISISIVFC